MINFTINAVDRVNFVRFVRPRAKVAVVLMKMRTFLLRVSFYEK